MISDDELIYFSKTLAEIWFHLSMTLRMGGKPCYNFVISNYNPSNFKRLIPCLFGISSMFYLFHFIHLYLGIKPWLAQMKTALDHLAI